MKASSPARVRWSVEAQVRRLSRSCPRSRRGAGARAGRERQSHRLEDALRRGEGEVPGDLPRHPRPRRRRHRARAGRGRHRIQGRRPRLRPRARNVRRVVRRQGERARANPRTEGRQGARHDRRRDHPRSSRLPATSSSAAPATCRRARRSSSPARLVLWAVVRCLPRWRSAPRSSRGVRKSGIKEALALGCIAAIDLEDDASIASLGTVDAVADNRRWRDSNETHREGQARRHLRLGRRGACERCAAPPPCRSNA